MLGRSWVEIDLSKLKQNYLSYKNLIREGQEIIAVIKANAYGHGDYKVAAALEEVGVKHFAVSNSEEGIRLRKHGVKGSILVLTYTPTECFSRLVEYDIMQAVISDEYARQIYSSGYPIKTQIAVDTGMNRVGLKYSTAKLYIERIKEYSRHFCVKGIFTHLSSTDNAAFTKRQIAKFKEIAEGCKNLNFEFVHSLNSIGGMRYNDAVFKQVRLGILLYGLIKENSVDIKPVLRWKSVVSMLKVVGKGEYIGYDLSYKAKKEMKIAVIPTGYADGYNRLLSNVGCVVIKGQKAPIVGKICMDQFMVDVTLVKGLRCGDGVTLIGEGYTAEDMARDLKTISYEIATSISNRVAKIYK